MTTIGTPATGSGTAELVAALRNSLKETARLRDRAAELESARSEPIAIVGAGCRYPGGVTSVDDLWALVDAGVDAVSGFPTNRFWDLEALYDPDPTVAGTAYTRQGGFLHDADRFDPSFFGISPREATTMDPQQRIALEIAWEALEYAGLTPEDVRGTATGVYVGAAYQGYGEQWRAVDESRQGQLVTGMSNSVVSGRLAYTLGLHGPAITVDTACSSSLVAIDLAVKALRAGSIDRALAGGVAVIGEPIGIVGFARQRGLATDGRCKAFGADADGMGFGEGAGLLVLERLSDARRDGHPVLAVIRGSAINSDGASNGLSAPNGTAQRAVIAAALADAGVEPDAVDAVEAHGTGTRLGDPVEADALVASYGRPGRGRPLYVGSVKSNIAHAQAASGVAGILKMIGAMAHRRLPATLHCSPANPLIDLDDSPVVLLDAPRSWPDTGREPCCAVSSFGLSGTNAHVVVSAPPERDDATSADHPRPSLPLMVPVSARSTTALRAQAARLAGALAGRTPADVAVTLGRHRAMFEERAAVVGTSVEHLVAGLTAVAEDTVDLADVVASTGSVTTTVRTAFVFPGQGGQWVGMARDLVAHDPVFAAALTECAEALAEFVDVDIVAVLVGDDDAWTRRVDVVQPALWAMMVALARWWGHHGVEPVAVTGHSQGEIAAAVVAGALSLRDGAKVVALRSRRIVSVSGEDGMLSVGVGEDAARFLLSAWPDVHLAAVNSPSSVVLAGPGADLDRCAAAAAAQGIRVRRVNVDYASHTPRMNELRDALLADLADITPRPTSVPFYSALSGGVVEPTTLGAGYWCDNLRGAVRFDDVTRAVVADGIGALVEVGPHPVLVPAMEETVSAVGSTVPVLATLRRDTGVSELAAALGTAFVIGLPVRADRQSAATGGRHRPLPGYAFDRARYWLEPVLARSAQATVGRLEVGWAPLSPRPAVEPVRLRGRWIVIVPSGDRPSAWAAALASAGDEVVVVDHHTDHGTSLPIADAAGVVCLAGLDDGQLAASGRAAAFDAALDAFRATSGTSTPVWWVTSGAVATTAGDAAAPAGAQVWGLGRIVRAEEPQRFGGLVDVPAVPDDAALQGIVAVLGGRVGDDRQVAVRDIGVLGRRISPLPPSTDTAWEPRDTVLVTGGTGGLGARVSLDLARRGARRVVLASRSGPDAASAAELADAIAGAGAHVLIRACDVTDRDAVAGLLAEIDGAGPGLRAVVHTAGVLDDVVVRDLTASRADTVFAAKVRGAETLDALTADRELDAFVLFSSLAGTAGGSGQASYAAANAHLDALAVRRRARGQTATSIAWGAWGGGGLVDAATADRLRATGVTPMDPDAALAAMYSAVAGRRTSLVVADIDWTLLVRADPSMAGDPVWSSIPGITVEASEPAAARWSTREEVAAGVRHIVARVLGFADAAEVSATRTFRDSGFDSIGAVDLRNRIVRATGLTVPVTLVFDHPTVADLVDHLCVRLGLADDDPAADAIVAPPDAAAHTDDPVVVVSMACRLPGGVSSPEELWQMLVDEVDAVGPFPTDRGWDLDRYDPDPDVVGTFSVTGGGFLSDAASFDPSLFGMSPREALATDPQHRLLLETTWEAFERAGVDPLSVRGGRGGVFIGASYNDYGTRLSSPPPELEGYLALGSASSVLSGRISYTFGLHGPSLTVDTACSSSLVATHLAVRAIRGGECDFALAGGASVMSTIDTFVEFSRQRVMSADGRCRSFSDAADGAGWAEGVAVVLLERRSRAERLGHPILAEINGTAVNSDGASNGLTAPNGPAQSAVIAAALADAGLRGRDVAVVEAHGTGTPLGDPIEVGALAASYGADRGDGGPLLLTALKANTGHTQAAAGIAGLIKSVLSVRRGVLPRSLHSERPSSLIDWSTVRLVDSTRAWPMGAPHRIGISAFGVSGTNAHVVLSRATQGRPAEETTPDAPTGESGESGADAAAATLPLLLSAATDGALADMITRTTDVVRGLGEGERPAFAASLLTRRAQLDRRAALLSDGRVVTRVPTSGRLAVVFSGQGTQWTGMGLDLARRCATFDRALDEVASSMDGVLGVPLRQVLAGDLDDTALAQPAIFAVEVALYRTLTALEVTPDVVAGHSIGEIAAAHVAGVFGLEDAVRLVVARGRLMGELVDGGSMIAVAAPVDRVRQAIEAVGPTVAVAAENAPTATVISGQAAATHAVAEALAREGVRTTPLRVSHAFHSPLMEPVLEAFRREVAALDLRPPGMPVVSTVTGSLIADELATVDHWVRQVCSPVLFRSAIADMSRSGVGTVVEVGPDARLSRAVLASVEADTSVTCVATMRRDQRDDAALMEALATLWVGRRHVAWRPVLPAVRTDPAGLHTYPFDRRRFWIDDVPAPRPSQGVIDGHVPLAVGGDILTARFDAAEPDRAWIPDHRILGRVLIPGTALVDLLVDVGARLGHEVVAELVVAAPMPVDDDRPVEVQVHVDPPGRDGGRAFTVSGRGADSWTVHATGLLRPAAAPIPDDTVDDDVVAAPEDGESVDMRALYASMAADGFEYGPAFATLDGVRVTDGVVHGRVALPASVRSGGHRVHPALLDAALHAVALVGLTGIDGGLVPFSFSGAVVRRPGVRAARAVVRMVGDDAVAVALQDDDGRCVFTLDRLLLRPASAVAEPPTTSVYRPVWRVVDTPPAPAVASTTVRLDSEVAGREPAGRVLQDAAVECVASVDDLEALIEGGRPAPATVLVDVTGGGATEDEAAEAGSVGAAVLALVQRFMASDVLRGSRLVAVVVGGPDGEGADTDPVSQAAGALVRSAANESPGQFGVVEVWRGVAGTDVVAAACALGREPVVAVGADGSHHVRRIEPVRGETVAGLSLDGGPVVVTGATGTLGGAVARHLAQQHGVRDLVVCSRRGASAPGADVLAEDLEAAGARVRFVAADVGDHATFAAVLDEVVGETPVQAVVHAAGVVDDGVISALDATRLARVFRPKIDAAVTLAAVATQRELGPVVLFSSIAGMVGSAGQGNYAAANAFLDAVARRSAGSGGVFLSVAWGLWADASGMTGGLGDTDRARVSRAGLSPMSTDEALAAFDRALRVGEPVTVASAFDTEALRRLGDGVVPLFADLVPAVIRPTVTHADPTFPEEIVRLDPADRVGVAADLVASVAARVLGHTDVADLDLDRGLLDIGFDSLTAVELRNQLTAATGRRLPATLVFDHPTVSAIADLLVDEIVADLAVSVPAAEAGEARPPRPRPGGAADGPSAEDLLAEASDEEIFDFIDRLDDDLGAR